MIQVTHLTKSFGAVQAVQDVSFDAPDGLITGLLGPNGAGKSTTMRLVAGALEPDSGRTTIDGFDTHTQRLEAQTRLGVLTDAHGLYQRLTARENVRYFGRLRGLGGQELAGRIDELITLLDMADIADRRTEGFSTGEQGKVAIARTLCMEPLILMFDEPTSALDPEMIKEVLDVMRDLATSGYTVLAVTHEMGFARTVADRVIFMDGGLIVEQNTPTEFFANPQNERTRQFLSQILSH